jgi:site-specific DNA recombinase
MAHQWTRSKGRLYRYYVCHRALAEGRSACPSSSLPAHEVEKFIVDRIRGVAQDAALRKEVFAQALNQVEAERRDLRTELKRLERERARAQREVDNLVVSVASAVGKANAALTEALATAQDETDSIAIRIDDAEARAKTLESQRLDEDDLGHAFDGFDAVWEALLVPERERVIRLLIQRVTYDGTSKRLSITFHPTGIASLAAEIRHEATS